jgi:hypothetical protein
MKLFYYNIKGKTGEGGYGGNWSFPPIWTDFIEAEDRKRAHELINEQYGKQFPTRVLRDDLGSNEFLLTIKEVKPDDKYTLSLNEVRTCKNPSCGHQYRIIEKYQLNDTGGGHDYCSYKCSKEAHQFEFYTSDTSTVTHYPVIYKITHKETGKCYIGQTTQPFTLRWYQHFFQGSETKFHQVIRANSVKDWNFEVLEVIDAKLLNLNGAAELKEYIDGREKYYIVLFDSVEDGYNTIGKDKSKPADKNQIDMFAGSDIQPPGAEPECTVNEAGLSCETGFTEESNHNRKPLPPLIQALVDGIEKKGLKIAFGLEQQGHIPTIERILADLGSNEYAWDKIGKEIGWCPKTACYHYVKYLQDKLKQPIETHAE